MFDLSTLGPDGGSSPCADRRRCVGGGGLFAGRQTALCLCFADVCWNALLEGAISHSRLFRGGEFATLWPHEPVLSMRIKVPLKSWLKYTPLLLCRSHYSEHIGIEGARTSFCMWLLNNHTTMCDCLVFIKIFQFFCKYSKSILHYDIDKYIYKNCCFERFQTTLLSHIQKKTSQS